MKKVIKESNYFYTLGTWFTGGVQINSYPLFTNDMEVMARDSDGKDLFYIFVYWLNNFDPEWLDFKSSLPEFVFELSEVKPLVKEMLSTGIDEVKRTQLIYSLIDKLTKIPRIKRWYFSEGTLDCNGKICAPYSNVLRELVDQIEEPLFNPILRFRRSCNFSSLSTNDSHPFSR